MKEDEEKAEEVIVEKGLSKNIPEIFEERLIAYENDAEKEGICEICGMYCSLPVTYHMRQCHPGCGRPAGGQGYNSGGGFSEGWAGNCGDGGIGSSTWYLVCRQCRLRYQQAANSSNENNDGLNSNKKQTPLSNYNFNKLSTRAPIMDFHLLTKNALFLLELSNNSSYESFKEPPPLFSPPSNSMFFPTTPFTYLNMRSSEPGEEQAPSKEDLDNMDTIKRRSHKSSGSSSEDKDVTNSYTNNSNHFNDTNNDLNDKIINSSNNDKYSFNDNKTNVKGRPRSVYVEYKFKPTNASCTYFNLTETIKEQEITFPFHRSVSEIDSVHSKYIR